MNLLDRLLGHDAWTTRQLLLIADTLSDEQLDSDLAIGHRTVRATFGHIIRNVEAWSDGMMGSSVDDNERQSQSGDSVSQLIERLDRAAGSLASVARSVEQRNGWDEKWTDQLDGQEKTFGTAIAHVITHSMHHRAQLLYMLRRLGVSDRPEGDVFSWENQIATFRLTDE
jgi:uncharacterized damage-inducible protein DinB